MPDIDDGKGSRVFNIDDGMVELIDVSIAEMTITGGDTRGNGGAIYAAEKLRIYATAITSNSAEGFGGGIGQQDGHLVCIDSTFTGNASLLDGGGIPWSFFGADITGCTFRENFSARGGGAFSGMVGAQNIDSCVIIVQHRVQYGGGLAFAPASQVSLTNSIVSDNSADRGGGIWMDLTGVQLIVERSEVRGNAKRIAEKRV